MAGEGLSLQMCDRDIRARLDVWLGTEYAYDASTVICHEFAIPRPSARIDIAVVNGTLAGFEIKSDVDSLTRLPRQVASFSCVFERATLVTTTAHLKKAIGLLPSWWGVMVPHDVDKGFRHIRRGRLNRRVSGEKALHLLTREELKAIATLHNCQVGRSTKKAALVETIVQSVKAPELMQDVRERLKARFNQADCKNPQTVVHI